VILNRITDSEAGSVFLTGSVILTIEFIGPMLFGVYLANKERYKINFIKFLFIFFVLLASVLLLGRLSMVLSPVLIFFLMWIIRIEKKVQKLPFASVVLFELSGAPGLFVLIYFDMGIMGLALVFISKGMIYGKTMQIIYVKWIKK
jgi:hypothetical protein